VRLKIIPSSCMDVWIFDRRRVFRKRKIDGIVPPWSEVVGYLPLPTAI